MTAVLIFLAGTGAVLGALALRDRLWGFASQRPSDYVATAPRFDLREHLSGPISCEGVVYGPTGRVASRFVADMEASWQGNVGTMTEQFRYDSGARQSRRWVLTLGSDGAIEAEAPDVVGKGQGRQAGAAVRLKYRIRLPEDAGGHVLDAVDWMYLTENGTILNRSQFRKYGIKVAELVATMRRKEAA